ncbi:MAG TPA: hypothetical protein VIB07_07525 [Nitrososphaera sp.]
MEFHEILSARGLNTLMFTDPYAKFCFTANLASRFSRPIYFDLDTTFTAYLRAGLVKARADIYLPSESNFILMLKDVLSSIETSDLVIFDSVNSFYSLFRLPEKSLGSRNHLLSILLMLLVRRGVDCRVPVLATSMLRYRHAGGWIQSPTSRRLLQNKSAVKLKVEWREPQNSLILTVLEHDSIPQGSELVCENTAVLTA